MTTACRASGFTLIELLVVLLLVALGSTLVALSLRDTPQHQLEREADRLIGLLETARAQARSRNTPLLWQADDQGYAIRPAHTPTVATLNDTAPERTGLNWLTPGTRAEPALLVISAEPVQAPWRLQLIHTGAVTSRVTLGSDGAEAVKVLP